MSLDSGYLSPKTAAVYLDMSPRSFDAWARREGVPCVWVGRARRFTKSNLDRAVKAMSLRPRLRRSA